MTDNMDEVDYDRKETEADDGKRDLERDTEHER